VFSTPCSLPPAPSPLPPEPQPPPPQSIEAELAALGQLARAKATELVKSQYFDREKKALAESFLATAKWIEENNNCSSTAAVRTFGLNRWTTYNTLQSTCLTPEQARTKQRDNSRKYLASVSRDSWQTWDAFDCEISKQLADIDAAHVLTVAQIGHAYKQIGLGLQ
jgi:hypothetical protein